MFIETLVTVTAGTSGTTNGGQPSSGAVRNEHLNSHQQQLGDRLYPKVTSNLSL